jgi:hypothetical protein
MKSGILGYETSVSEDWGLLECGAVLVIADALKDHSTFIFNG